ncbi:MAG: trimeric intracellular cation channel family protein [Chloroflexi bacterium]|nr:trimeric intracellular cation channel family protein [Chloroflexota bacterium]MBV9546537.1 trimeric intracellular cation channel family protein [Chloroflexota bacterium]
METLVLAIDLFGTFVFALSGAMAGVRKRFDLFGVLVLSYAASTAGGITRDLLIGAVPPASVADWRYIVVPVVAGLATFRWHPVVQRWQSPVLVFDAAGLALFAVSGALKASAYGLNPLAATMLGVVTAVGGGIVRDVLLAEVPTVLHAELYAVAALAAAVVVVGGQLLQLPNTPIAILGAFLCFGLRLVAIRRGWRLPVARVPERRSDQEKKDKEEARAS